MAAIMTISGAGVEQRVATEQSRRITVPDDADMRHRMAGGVETFELDGVADLYNIAGAQPAVHLWNFVAGVDMCQHFGAGGRDHLAIPSGVIAMLVGI